MLTRDELERYNRQIMINGLGEEGQAKLKQARVFIAGAGGLGSPAALYLTAAGVGTIRIVDHDKVELDKAIQLQLEEAMRQAQKEANEPEPEPAPEPEPQLVTAQ